MQRSGDSVRAEDGRLLSILKAVEVRLYVVDRRLRLTRADGPLDPFTGISSGESSPPPDFLGKSLLSYLSEPQRGCWSAIARKVMEEIELDPGESAVVQRIGPRLIHVSTEALRDVSGTVTGALFISREISEGALQE